MKKLTSLILTVCLFFSLIVPFSFSVSASSFPWSDNISDPVLNNWRYNFDPYSSPVMFGSVQVSDNGLLDKNVALFYDSADDTLKLVFPSAFSSNPYVVYGSGYKMVAGGAVTSIPAAYYSLDAGTQFFIYYRLNYTEYINTLSPGFPVMENGLNLPYRTYSDSYMSDAFVSKFSSSFVLPLLKVNGDIENKYPGAMSCSYNEATGVISCTDPNTNYDFDFTLPSGVVSGTSSASEFTRIYVSTLKVQFDDYYTGTLVFDTSLSGLSIDGAVISGKNVFVTDCKEFTIYQTSMLSSGQVPSLTYSIDNFYLMSSRLSIPFLSSVLAGIYNGMGQITSGYDDLVQGTDDLKGTNQDLENNLNDYNQIEGDIQTDFDDALNKVDTSQGLFDLQDFASTANWVSVQLTNLYNSHDSIKYATGFALIFGLSLMIIGRRWR